MFRLSVSFRIRRWRASTGPRNNNFDNAHAIKFHLNSLEEREEIAALFGPPSMSPRDYTWPNLPGAT
jgi:hypothetical protein